MIPELPDPPDTTRRPADGCPTGTTHPSDSARRRTRVADVMRLPAAAMTRANRDDAVRAISELVLARPTARMLVDRLTRLIQLALLPADVLRPLRRRGLDPVDALSGDQPPVSPLARLGGKRLWVVTGYREARAVLADTEAYSNDFHTLTRGSFLSGHRSPGGLGFSDPPEHDRLRRLLIPEFSRARLAALEPVIRRIVDDRLDAMAARGATADLWAEFALPIPTATICELLGVREDRWDELQRLSTSRFDLLNGPSASLGAITRSLEALTEVVREQRREPGPGLIGRMITRHGDSVGDDELAGLADGLLTGGLESTASMLALGCVALLGDAHLAERMRRGGADTQACVDELLRHLTVVQVAFPRFARRDLDIAGARIAQGDVVVCSLAAANRSPELGAEPNEIRPDRSPNPHVAFGHGAHRCIGAELARTELRIAFPALLHRFPRLRLAVPAAQLRYRQGSIVYGVEELPVSLTPAARAHPA